MWLHQEHSKTSNELTTVPKVVTDFCKRSVVDQRVVSHVSVVADGAGNPLANQYLQATSLPPDIMLPAGRIFASASTGSARGTLCRCMSCATFLTSLCGRHVRIRTVQDVTLDSKERSCERS
jgi:hypothetical protein